MKWIALIALVLMIVAGCTGSDFEYQEEEEKIHEVERPQPGIEEHIPEDNGIVDIIDFFFDWFWLLLLLPIVSVLEGLLKSSRRRRW